MALLRAGYTGIEMWECQWDRLVDNEAAVSQFIRSFDLVPPLEPRGAFFWWKNRRGGSACRGWGL